MGEAPQFGGGIRIGVWLYNVFSQRQRRGGDVCQAWQSTILICIFFERNL